MASRRYFNGGLVVASVAITACSPAATTQVAGEESTRATTSPLANPPSSEVLASSATLKCTATGSEPFTSADVTIQADGSDIRVSWKWAGGAPPAIDTFGLFATLTASNGEVSHQLGYTALDGKQIALFDFDMGRGGKQENVRTEPIKTSNSMTLLFPGAASAYPQGFKAKGAVTVAGSDVMVCS